MKPIYFALVLVLSSFSAITTAQTHNWTGNGGDTDWFNTSNWDAGTVPIGTSTVSIVGNVSVLVSGSAAEAYTIDLHNNSTLELDGNLNTDSIITVHPSATFKYTGGTLSGSGILNNGLLLFEGNGMRTLSNTIITNNNQFLVIDTGLTQILSSTINNNSTGTLEIASVGGFIQLGTTSVLNNSGLLLKSPDGITSVGNFYLVLSIINDGVFEVLEDQIVLLLANSGTLTNSTTGRIIGNGTYDITAQFINMGIIAPGDSPDVGSIDVTNNFSLNGGTIELDILGSDAGSYDTVRVTGFPDMDGFLDINLQYAPSLGDSFEVITWSPNGNSCLFPATTTASFDGQEYTFDINCNGNDVTLVVSDITVLGTTDEASQKFDFFITPNPVVSEAIFNFSSELGTIENPSVVIYNYLGQEIMRRDGFTSENNIFSRGNLPSGLYFAQLETNNTIVATTRIVLK